MKIIPGRLCTEAARDPDVMDWADRRARHNVVPPWITSIWTPPASPLPSETDPGAGLP